MITDDEVMRLFEQADPARTTDDHNDTPDATGYLAALRTRSNNVTYIDTTETSTEQPNNRRWFMIGAAVAAVAIVVVGGLVLLTGNEDTTEPEVPATAPPTVPATTVAPTTAAAPSVEDAVGRASTFLASFEQRDVGLVEEQLADGLVARSAFPDEPFGEPSTFASNGWLDLRYQVLTGTTYVEPACSIVTPGPAESVVECETTMELAGHRITNTPGVPAVVTLNVTEAGIATMDSALGANLGLLAFEDWKEANWPAEVPIDDGIGTSEDLVVFARTEEQLAREWVDWGVATIDDLFSLYDAGNLDDFLARFAPGNSFAGASDEVVAAFMAGGQRYEASNCQPAGIETGGLRIVCDVVGFHPSYEASRVTATGRFGFVVAADGTVVENSNSLVWQPSSSFNFAFKQWLQDTHPDVYGQITWLADVSSASAADQPVVAQYVEEFVEQSDVYPLGG